MFVPCYVDQFFPRIAIATYELLEKAGCNVVYPDQQTCCGQPTANSGYHHLNSGCNRNFIRNFSGFDYIVAPSASCVLHIKEHLTDTANETEVAHIRNTIFELSEFLTDILKITVPAFFPHKVGLHMSCHGQRMLGLASMSERNMPPFSKIEDLLGKVRGLELVKPERVDECCGFGGTFSVLEEAVSVRMGEDRIAEHEKNDVEYITGFDISCLMHMEGILKRRSSRIKVIHFAEILNAHEHKLCIAR